MQNFTFQIVILCFCCKKNFLICFFLFSEPNLLVRACNQLGQFLSNRETNLRYLALESMCHLATSEYSHDAVKKHQEVVILSMKVGLKNF